jgi:hypothetical protein
MVLTPKISKRHAIYCPATRPLLSPPVDAIIMYVPTYQDIV